MDLNCINCFMRTYKSLFILIRSNPRDLCYIDLLKTFEKYIDLELSAKMIAKLKNDIDKIENIDTAKKDFLKEELEIYKTNEIACDIDKLKKHIYLLKDVADKMIKLLVRKEYERVHDFADAIHNFPEFLVTGHWSDDDYYKIYIKPYNMKWKDNCLYELKGRNKIKVLLSKYFA